MRLVDEVLFIEAVFHLGNVPLIVEQRIRTDGNENELLFGYLTRDRKRIYVNPIAHESKHALVSTLLHEAIHLARPKMSEMTVRRAEHRIMRALSVTQVDAIYNLYNNRVKREEGVRAL
jgi:molybdopterin biosynthesis enzyme